MGVDVGLWLGDGVEEAGLADGVDVVGGEGVDLQGVGRGALAELGEADVHLGVGVGGDDASSVAEACGAAAVVEV